MRIAVVGATSWGCTLAWLLERRGHEVEVVCRSAEEAAGVEARRGLERLPEVVLGPRVRAVAVPAAGADGMVLAVPAQSLRATLRAGLAAGGTRILGAAKGIEFGTLRRMSEVVVEEGIAPAAAVSVLSGPNLAGEIARGLPAAAVVACQDEEDAAWWQEALNGTMFRVYTSDDVVGVEIAGALKNVIAIAVGATAGMGFGTNATAALMTRGLAEITRLGVALGADPLTFLGLAGMGDLVATCFSELSRNRQFGVLVARGMDPGRAMDEVAGVVEGMQTAGAAVELAHSHRVEMPISEHVAAVVEGRMTVGEAMVALLGRTPRPE